MIRLKSRREIEIIGEAAAILRRAFKELRPALQPGVSTLELDEIAEAAIRRGGGQSAFKGYRGFPRTLCVSIDEEVVHGIPSARKLKQGDLVSLDLGVKYEGYYADAARSWIVGKGSEEARELIRVSRGAFLTAVEATAKDGARIGDLSWAVQQFVERNGFGVGRDYVGHGIGQAIHEDPQVPNYGEPGRGPKLKPGMVLAIEPMVNAGTAAVQVDGDGWTARTADGSLSAHFEYSVAVTEHGARILGMMPG